MAADRQPPGRPALFDADDPSRLMNELLLTILVPAALVFAGVLALFRLYLDEALRSWGLVQMTPHPMAFVALQGGYGRFLLAIVLTALVVLAYVVVYVRVLRAPLRERGVV